MSYDKTQEELETCRVLIAGIAANARRDKRPLTNYEKDEIQFYREREVRLTRWLSII